MQEWSARYARTLSISFSGTISDTPQHTLACRGVGEIVVGNPASCPFFPGNTLEFAFVVFPDIHYVVEQNNEEADRENNLKCQYHKISLPKKLSYEYEKKA